MITTSLIFALKCLLKVPLTPLPPPPPPLIVSTDFFFPQINICIFRSEIPLFCLNLLKTWIFMDDGNDQLGPQEAWLHSCLTSQTTFKEFLHCKAVCDVMKQGIDPCPSQLGCVWDKNELNSQILLKKPIFKWNATLPCTIVSVKYWDFWGGKRFLELKTLQDHSVEGYYQSGSKITLKY